MGGCLFLFADGGGNDSVLVFQRNQFGTCHFAPRGDIFTERLVGSGYLELLAGFSVFRNSFFSCITGPGHISPQASTFSVGIAEHSQFAPSDDPGLQGATSLTGAVATLHVLVSAG